MEEINYDQLKIEINTLCWTRLPGYLTLDQAESIAMKMWTAMTDEINNITRPIKMPINE